MTRTTSLAAQEYGKAHTDGSRSGGQPPRHPTQVKGNCPTCGQPHIAAQDGLMEALQDMTDHYVRLIDSGDAGSWNPRDEPVVQRALAALSLMQPEIDSRVAEERAKLLERLRGLELAGSAFAQLRSTIAIRFDGMTETSLWFALNKAFDDLANARAVLAQFEKENSHEQG